MMPFAFARLRPPFASSGDLLLRQVLIVTYRFVVIVAHRQLLLPPLPHIFDVIALTIPFSKDAAPQCCCCCF